MNRRMTCSPNRSRFAILPLALGIVATAACSPITTQNQYAASDGILVDIADGVRGINLLVVSDGDGAAGSLLGAIANNTGDDVSVTVGPEGGQPLEIPVNAGQTVYLNTDTGFAAQFGMVDAAPGATLPIVLITDGGDPTTVEVPVLDGTLPEYEGELP